MLGREAVIDGHHLDAHRRGDRNRLDQRAAARPPHEGTAVDVDEHARGIALGDPVRGFDDVDGDAVHRGALLAGLKMLPHLGEAVVVVAIVKGALLCDIGRDVGGRGRGGHALGDGLRLVAELVRHGQGEGRHRELGRGGRCGRERGGGEHYLHGHSPSRSVKKRAITAKAASLSGASI